MQIPAKMTEQDPFLKYFESVFDDFYRVLETGLTGFFEKIAKSCNWRKLRHPDQASAIEEPQFAD